MVNRLLVFRDPFEDEGVFDEVLSLLLKSSFDYDIIYPETCPELFDQYGIKELPTVVTVDKYERDMGRIEGFDVNQLGIFINSSY